MAIRYVLQPTKNHNARIVSYKTRYGAHAVTKNRDDDFGVQVYSDTKGNGKRLMIRDHVDGEYRSISLDSRQIQTLLRVLEKHANIVVE